MIFEDKRALRDLLLGQDTNTLELRVETADVAGECLAVLEAAVAACFLACTPIFNHVNNGKSTWRWV